jgi:exosome complex component RRP42
MIFIDLHILDYDGNLMDAAVLGAVAALLDTKIPKATVVDDEIVIDRETMEPLPIRDKALMCTFAKIGEQMVLDPSLDEEEILSARISIGMTASGNICALQKGGETPLTKEEIMNAVKVTEEKTKELMEYLP